MLGALLLARSIRSRAGGGGRWPAAPRAYAGSSWRRRSASRTRAGLVGRGPPFWLATGVFVFVAILAFRWTELKARGELAKGAAVAAACAIGTAAAVTLVFQELFLVRLP